MKYPDYAMRSVWLDDEWLSPKAVIFRRKRECQKMAAYLKWRRPKRRTTDSHTPETPSDAPPVRPGRDTFLGDLFAFAWPLLLTWGVIGLLKVLQFLY